MDFRLTEEQELLRDSVARFLHKEYRFVPRERIADTGRYSAPMWRAFADLGLLAIPFPDAGTSASNAVDTLIVMEEFGRHLVVEPFIPTAVVGGRLIRSGAAEAARPQLVQALVAGELQLGIAIPAAEESHDGVEAVQEGDSYRLHGKRPLVLGGSTADKLIVAARWRAVAGARAGLTLFLVDAAADGIMAKHYATPAGQPISDFEFHATRAEPEAVLGLPGDAQPLLVQALDEGAAALCAQAVGSMSHLLEATGAHLKSRQQYGAPLARLQALQHRMADMFVALELARPMCMLAAVSLESPPDRRSAYVSAAYVQTLKSARLIGQQAVQLHGGMGMSEELDVAHHFKFLSLLPAMFGDERYHLERFSALAERLDAAGAAGFASNGLAYG